MDSNSAQMPKCKKCLIREMADMETVFRTIHDYIENLDVDVKTPAELYEKRLQTCTECEMLLAGMCRSCGCYVEMRAAAVKNECPRSKW